MYITATFDFPSGKSSKTQARAEFYYVHILTIHYDIIILPASLTHYELPHELFDIITTGMTHIYPSQYIAIN